MKPFCTSMCDSTATKNLEFADGTEGTYVIIGRKKVFKFKHFGAFMMGKKALECRENKKPWRRTISR